VLGPKRYFLHPQYGAAVHARTGKQDIASRKNAFPASDINVRGHFAALLKKIFGAIAKSRKPAEKGI
jgi:hypothetical protein